MLKKIKACVLDEGTEVGEHDISGNRYAGCHFMDNGWQMKTGMRRMKPRGSSVRTSWSPSRACGPAYSKHLGSKEMEEIASQVREEYIRSRWTLEDGEKGAQRRLPVDR
jgi:hypothetical protein